MPASLTLFEHEHKAREKYIYFICSVAGALFAYIGKDYKPNSPWTIHDTYIMWTLGCLIASFVFGLTRILVYIQGMSANRDVLVAQEEIANLNKSLSYHLENQHKEGTPVSLTGGKLLDRKEIEILIGKLNVKKAKDSRWMETLHKWSTFFLVVCQIFLVAGFILLLWSNFKL